jgi:CRP-like cAMP-binding protein
VASPDRQTPAVTGNSASRVAAHRERHERLDVYVTLQMGATIAELASYFGCRKADVVRAMLRYAATNRDWKRQGLIWRD